MKFEDLKNVKLANKTILVDVSHVKSQGDEITTPGGLVMGRVEQSEIPTYGYVVAKDESLELIDVGDLVTIAQAGSLRSFDWPDKPKDRKLVAMRFDFVDGIIKL